MKKCAFLSMDSLKAYECYDDLLVEPFNKTGWKVDTVSWRDETVEWAFYDAVIIRSCWDYQQNPNEFIKVLSKIDLSSARLANSLDLVRWNIEKTYLKNLREQSIAIVPTLWEANFNSKNLSTYFAAFDTGEIIIKPVIGANADRAFRVKKESSSAHAELIKYFGNSSFLVQPFVKSIIDEGEYSLFYFGGCYSHSILKTPKKGDFRSQEEHGSKLQLVKAGGELLKSGEKALLALPEQPLYARIDFVRGKNSFLLMEVELIEPSLYFNMDPDSPHRFVEAFESWWKDNRS